MIPSIRVNVFVSSIPSIDLILFTTITPRFSKSSPSIFASRSYSPNNGWSSTTSGTLESLADASCSRVGAMVIRTKPIARYIPPLSPISQGLSLYKTNPGFGEDKKGLKNSVLARRICDKR